MHNIYLTSFMPKWEHIIRTFLTLHHPLDTLQRPLHMHYTDLHKHLILRVFMQHYPEVH